MINKYRPHAMGINQTMGSTAAILGTFVAAGFVKHNAGGGGGWQWLTIFNRLFMPWLAPPSSQHTSHRRLSCGDEGISGKSSPVSTISAFSCCASLASLILGLTWGGSTYPWSSGKIIAMLTCGCGGLALFGLYEWLGKSDGLFYHRLLQTANFPILLFVCMVDGMLLLGVNVLYSQEIADPFTTDAVNIALIFITISDYFNLWLPPRWLHHGQNQVLPCSAHRSPPVVRSVHGLMALINPHRLAMACVFSVLFGIATAVTTVIPSMQPPFLPT